MVDDCGSYRSTNFKDEPVLDALQAVAYPTIQAKGGFSQATWRKNEVEPEYKLPVIECIRTAQELGSQDIYSATCACVEFFVKKGFYSHKTT